MQFYRLLADAVVVGHFAYVAFVVFGLAAIVAGGLRGWAWVRNFWFRAVHSLLIGIVVVESLCGIVCPMTTWEDRLREAAGETVEGGSFIGRWAHDLLFVNASPWALTTSYVLFGAAVLAALIWVPPRRPRFWRTRNRDAG
jgi:hypothetical protein